MKNIQVIDGAKNCVYDIYQISDESFELIFPSGGDIAFIEDIYNLRDENEVSKVDRALKFLWEKRIPKAEVNGIHGILFFGLIHKKQYYPTLKDEEACNPNGSKLRP